MKTQIYYPQIKKNGKWFTAVADFYLDKNIALMIAENHMKKKGATEFKVKLKIVELDRHGKIMNALTFRTV